MINAERLLVGLFSAEHLTGQTFNLWLSGAFSPLISQRRCSASWGPRASRAQSLPVTGCRRSAHPVSGTICRLSCKGRLTGGEVTSYWHHGVESEHTGMEEEINLGSNTRTPLRPLPYRYPRSCTGYCWVGVVQSWDYHKAGRHNKNYKTIYFYSDFAEDLWSRMNSKQRGERRGGWAANVHSGSHEVTKQQGMWLFHITVHKTDYWVIQLHANSIWKLTH